ncbi:hypothetical protein K457DRAFT_25778 [Linnemannia elongata AG-77]|uniref:Uncharacterized protein n=1 Tax=Linnemannia elongata AG-77 TaxID=1314771 RepID=A0A197JCA5_9FUNG|nr:hypothetical protein K457DRAFT_25778 [Linnemannia elongata AG-77]
MSVKPQTYAYGLQLWINLPKQHNMRKSQYQELLDTQIPRARPQDDVVVKVIAGEAHGLKSQTYIRTPIITIYIGELGHETETKAHHTPLFSEDGTSTVKIQKRMKKRILG